MILEVYGLVKSKGKKIANGVDGRFQTDDPRIIAKLQQLGFKEIKEKTKEEPVKDKKKRNANNNQR